MSQAKRKLSAILLDVIINSVNQNGGEIHAEYSGRWMYGETCFGFAGDLEHIIGDILSDLSECPEEIEEFASMLKDSRKDQLGLEWIIYFPGWI